MRRPTGPALSRERRARLWILSLWVGAADLPSTSTRTDHPPLPDPRDPQCSRVQSAASEAHRSANRYGDRCACRDPWWHRWQSRTVPGSSRTHLPVQPNQSTDRSRRALRLHLRLGPPLQGRSRDPPRTVRLCCSRREGTGPPYRRPISLCPRRRPLDRGGASCSLNARPRRQSRGLTAART